MITSQFEIIRFPHQIMQSKSITFGGLICFDLYVDKLIG